MGGAVSVLEKKQRCWEHSQDGDTGTRRGLRTARPAHRAHQHPQAERPKATTLIISASNWGHWAVMGATAVSLEGPIPTQPPARPGPRGQGGCREPTGTWWWLESPTPQRQEVKEIMPFIFLIQASIPSVNSGSSPFYVLNPALKLPSLKAAFAACLCGRGRKPQLRCTEGAGRGH